MMTTHRLGKIARLPFDIRSELNRRLADNEPAPRLLRWLNAEPEVQEILEEQFDGRPITQQNISAWKRGGFRDWERFEQSRLQARTFLEEAGELVGELFDPEEVAGDNGSFLDRLGDRMALSLMQLFREVELRKKGPDRTRDLLSIAKELARLRRADHQRQRTALAQRRAYEESLQAAAKEQTPLAVSEFLERQHLNEEVKRYRAEFLEGLAEESLSPEQEKKIRGFFRENATRIAKWGLGFLPEGEELDRILEALREAAQPDGDDDQEEDEEIIDEEDGDLDEDEDYEDEESDDQDEEDSEEDSEETAGEAAPPTEKNKPSPAFTRQEIFSPGERPA